MSPLYIILCICHNYNIDSSAACDELTRRRENTFQRIKRDSSSSWNFESDARRSIDSFNHKDSTFQCPFTLVALLVSWHRI